MVEPTHNAPLSRRGFLAGMLPLAAAPALAEARGMKATTSLTDIAATPDLDWTSVRKAFSLPEELCYLNNGSLGPSPDIVVQSTVDASRRLERDPVRQEFGTLNSEAEEARAKAAAFLGCSTDELAVTRNTTSGMNMVAQGIDWTAGDRILTTDHEHGGGSVCWEYIAERHGVVIDKVALPVPPDSPGQLLPLFAEKMTPRTRVLSVSHVTYTTGLRLPVAAIAKLAHAAGALMIVDGAQAPGGLPVDVPSLDCDAYATSAHKWLLAPKGTGLLVIRKEAQDRIRPLELHHGYGVYSASVGTRNLPGIIGLGTAIDFLNHLGMARVEAHNLALRRRLFEGLRAMDAIECISPAADDLAAPLVTIHLPDGRSNTELARSLRAQHGVEVKVLSHGPWSGIRMSTHVYNDEEEIDRLLRALPNVL